MTVSIASRAAVCAFLFYSSIGFAAVTDEDSLAEAVAAGGSVKVAARQIKLSRTVSITRDTSIEGRSGRTVISGENAVRVFEVASNVNLTLIGLTIVNGRSTNGGAVYNDGGSVRVIDCKFLNNLAQGNAAAAGARGTNGTTNNVGWRPGDGGSGSPGEAARGGAVFSRGKLQVWSAVFQSNSAFASEGGAGGAGGHVLQTGPPGAGGDGGDGADAEGGAVYSDGMAEFFSTRFISNGARSSAGGYGGVPGTNSIRMYGVRSWGESGHTGSARGGAVFARGTVRSSDSTFDSNYLIGTDARSGLSGGGGGNYEAVSTYAADGRAGRDGGDVLGGAVFAQGDVTIARTIYRQNTAMAGKGGDGGDGGSAFGLWGSASGGDAGAAGIGGDAQGGAVAVLGELIVIDSKFFQNSVTAGGGGNGGSGGSSTLAPWPPPDGANGAPAGTAAGGAIFQAGGHFALTASDVSSNIVNAGGGGAGGGSGWSPNPAYPSGAAGVVGESGHVFGGGVCAFGATLILRTQIGFNTAIAAAGSNGIAGASGSKIGRSGMSGARGGSAIGGAAWFGGSVELRESSIVANRVRGGDGGNGGRGGSGLYTQSWGGSGGLGGDALGAGFYAEAEGVMLNCTVAHNTAAGGRGGVGANGYSQGFFLWQQPIDDAGSGGHGGNAAAGISLGTNALAMLSYCTIASNLVLIGSSGAGATNSFHPEGRWGRAGTNSGAAISSATSATLLACIIAGETGVNCAGNIVDAGFNLCSDSSCGFTTTTSLNNADPRLLPLARNGGPTLTMALAPESPARDAVLSDACPATDQRGYLRPAGSGCDIGAFEFDAVSAEQSNAFAIVGSVTDGDAGIAGVRVRIGRQIVMTDKSGKYRLNGLRPGNYIVRPVAPEILFHPPFHRVRLAENTMTPAFVVKTVRARRE